MIGKSLAVSVVIGGALAASFNRAFQTADKRASKLGQSLAKLTISRESIAAFGKLQSKLGKTATELQTASKKTGDLGRAVAKSETEIKKLEAAGKKAGKTVAEGMDTAKKAMLTWNQFTSQRMSQYMKDLGGHAPAINRGGQAGLMDKISIKSPFVQPDPFMTPLCGRTACSRFSKLPVRQ